MKQLSKERLEFIRKRASTSNEYIYRLRADEVEVMASSLLAGMSQEPVAYMHHSGQMVTREESCDDKTFAICCKVETPLYAAPPEPVLPDGLLSDMEEVLRISDRDHEAWRRAKAALDILKRAAPNMLADESLKDQGGALCGKRKADAWIPCSERMPEHGGAFQVWNGKHIGCVSFLFGSFQCLSPDQITHWQPLPAPPKESPDA